MAGRLLPKRICNGSLQTAFVFNIVLANYNIFLHLVREAARQSVRNTASKQPSRTLTTCETAIFP